MPFPASNSPAPRKNTKKNLATIPLSLRGKKRYILFALNVEGVSDIAPSRAEQALHAHLLQCYGVVGMPFMRFRFIHYDSARGRGVVRCAHYAKDAIIAALVLFSQFEGKPATLRTLQTSGTIKTLKESFSSHASRN